MFYRRGSGNDKNSGILSQLKFMEEFVSKTREDRVTVVNTQCVQSVYKNSSTVSCRR